MRNFETIPKPFIVAEIGNNHEGSVKNAMKLIKAAKSSGAHAVKFQVFDPYKYSSPKDKQRIKILNKFVLKRKDIIKLKKNCDKIGIHFFATPFDIKSAEFLNKIQDFFKISSGDNNYFDLLKKIRSFKKPVMISTGLINDKNISKIIKFFKKINFYNNKKNLCIMHCVSAYPASKTKINLNSIPYLKEKFSNLTIGYSDHTLGYKVASLSYVIGAEIIEKHFTLSNNFSSFRDHKISLNPKEFKKFVKEIKYLEKILGTFDKDINVEEINNLILMRRKLVSNKFLKKGQKINENDLIKVRSSEEGIDATELNQIKNKKLNRNIKKFENLLYEDFLK